MMEMVRLLPVAVLLLSLLPSCALIQGAAPDIMSEAQLVSLFNTIDRNELAGAAVAKQKAVSQPVRDYADRLMREHAALLSERQQLAHGLDLPIDKPQLASKLDGLNDRLLADLATRSGMDFDRAYINAQITKHEQALALARNSANSFTADSPFSQHLLAGAADFQAHSAKARTIHQQLLRSR